MEMETIEDLGIKNQDYIFSLFKEKENLDWTIFETGSSILPCWCATAAQPGQNDCQIRASLISNPCIF